MKKFMATLICLVLALSLLAFTGCEKDPTPPEGESLGTVRFATHAGQSAFQSGYLIKALDLNKDYNFEIEHNVMTGPNVYAMLASGDLDIGFLGNGMGWHYFEEDAKIEILTIDNLTNDDLLLMRTGMGFSLENTLDDLYANLPGKTLAVDLTTTPGSFLKSLVNAINKGRDDADKIWYEDVEAAYPLKGAADKQVIILNTTTANIPAAMQDASVDGCVAFGPYKAVLRNDTDSYVVAATTFTHLSDTITPSTWAVNKQFAAEHPELVQAFVKALVDAMDYRSKEENWDHCIEMAMAFDQLDADNYDPTAAYWPSREDLKNYYETPTSDAYVYLEQIRASHMGSNGLEDATAPKGSEVINDQFILAALGISR